MFGFRRVLSRLTGYRYHYRIRMDYRDPKDNVLAWVTITLVITTPELVNQHRKIKQALAGELINSMPKHLLCNGRVFMEPLCFLGWFKQK